MARTQPHKARNNRIKKLKKRTKGFVGAKSKQFKMMKQAAARGDMYAYRDRRTKKRDLRALWIVRINAGCKILGGSYSKFIGALKKKEIILDRKILAHLAATDFDVFKAVFEKATK